MAKLSASPAESQAVNRLVDRRLLFECAVTHYAAVNATSEQLDELERLTREMAKSSDWSYYHRMDEQFHQLVGTASSLDTAVEVCHETLAELYDYLIPYPIEKLHTSSRDHIALVAALRAGNVEEAVEFSRKHVDILHRTMFMGLTGGRAKASTSD
ncbi:FadR/GntR family transcriptional regulator [Arthrobacter sp. ISL-30]|uniref:FadR/GntR family transcriptional regulator n=1 Tax=Arthrobacter sp. ISL-30 TaxID=2819109 RepID=UPI00203583DE|nr:FCD domain-containing protein [Arthrobacter sp. ISL-30]